MAQQAGKIERHATRAFDVGSPSIVHEQHEHGDADERDGKADDEDGIEPARQRRQNPIGQQRADQHAGGVHRSVNPNAGEVLWTCGE